MALSRKLFKIPIQEVLTTDGNAVRRVYVPETNAYAARKQTCPSVCATVYVDRRTGPDLRRIINNDVDRVVADGRRRSSSDSGRGRYDGLDVSKVRGLIERDPLINGDSAQLSRPPIGGRKRIE